MNQELLAEKALHAVGRDLGQETSLPVEKEAIRQYCEATGILDPLYLDEEYAKSTPYGGVIAPSLFGFVAFTMLPGVFEPVAQGAELPKIARLMKELGLKGALDAGWKLQSFTPIHVGDVLTRSGRIMEAVPKQIKIGPAIFCTIEYTVTNQRGELVCIETWKYFFFGGE